MGHWEHLSKPPNENGGKKGKYTYLTCKYCTETLNGRPERARGHLNKCASYQEFRRNEERGEERGESASQPTRRPNALEATVKIGNLNTKTRNRLTSEMLQQLGLIKLNMRAENAESRRETSPTIPQRTGAKRRRVSASDVDSEVPTIGSLDDDDTCDDRNDSLRELADEAPINEVGESAVDGEDSQVDMPACSLDSVLDDSGMVFSDLRRSANAGCNLIPEESFDLDDPLISMRIRAVEEEDDEGYGSDASASSDTPEQSVSEWLKEGLPGL